MRKQMAAVAGALGMALLQLQPFATAQSLHVTAQPAASAPQLQQHFPRYKVQNEDTLLLSFPLSPEFNQSVTVQPDGFINLHAAPSLHVEGMTVPEIVAALQQSYSPVLNHPIIDVDLQDYQRPKFTISGQVAKPGQYELRERLTVAEAVAVAGGLNPLAKTQIFLFHRTSADWYQVERYNIKDILHGKDINEDPEVQPGDMIYIPEKFISNFRKYVPYSFGTGTYFNSF